MKKKFKTHKKERKFENIHELVARVEWTVKYEHGMTNKQDNDEIVEYYNQKQISLIPRSKVMTYQELLDHLPFCIDATIPCPIGCGEYIKWNDDPKGIKHYETLCVSKCHDPFEDDEEKEYERRCLKRKNEDDYYQGRTDKMVMTHKRTKYNPFAWTSEDSDQIAKNDAAELSGGPQEDSESTSSLDEVDSNGYTILNQTEQIDPENVIELNVYKIPHIAQIGYSLQESAKIIDLKKLIAKNGYKIEIENCRLWFKGEHLDNKMRLKESGLFDFCQVQIYEQKPKPGEEIYNEPEPIFDRNTMQRKKIRKQYKKLWKVPEELIDEKTQEARKKRYKSVQKRKDKHQLEIDKQNREYEKIGRKVLENIRRAKKEGKMIKKINDANIYLPNTTHAISDPIEYEEPLMANFTKDVEKGNIYDPWEEQNYSEFEKKMTITIIYTIDKKEKVLKIDKTKPVSELKKLIWRKLRIPYERQEFRMKMGKGLDYDHSSFLLDGFELLDFASDNLTISEVPVLTNGSLLGIMQNYPPTYCEPQELGYVRINDIEDRRRRNVLQSGNTNWQNMTSKYPYRGFKDVPFFKRNETVKWMPYEEG